MSFKLLPKSTEEFSDTKFWDGFFKNRGSKAFEWYGEYQDMVELWAQYVKSGDRVLNIGCGNSELGAQLHDHQSCQVLCIDTSATVVKQMTRKHCGCGRRPRLTYQVMDAAKLTGLEDASFACAVDKGTLDALMSSADSAGGGVVDAMLAEVHRVLRIGGRHVIVSLCQRQVVDKLVEHITARQWIVRVHQATAVSASDPSGFPLPVFFIVLAKLKPGAASSLVQVQDAYSTGPPDRLDSVQCLASWIRRAQLTAYALARPDGAGDAADANGSKSKGDGDDSGDSRCRETSFAYACGRTGLPTFTCRLLTHRAPSKRRSGYAVFIEPLACGAASPAVAMATPWTPEQRGDLLESQASRRRLLFVRLHPWLHYDTDAAMQASLSRLVMAFAPRPGMPESEVPFLSTGQLAYPYRPVASEGRYTLEESVASDDGGGVLRLVCPSSDLSPLQCHASVALSLMSKSAPGGAIVDDGRLVRLLDAFVDDAGAATEAAPAAFVHLPCDLDCLLQRPRRPKTKSPSVHAASIPPKILELLSDRLGLACDRQLLTSSTAGPRRLVALFPPAESLAAYSAALSPESLAGLADAVDVDAGGRLLVATRLFDVGKAAAAVADANAAGVAALRRCRRFADVVCAVVDEGDDSGAADDEDDDVAERRWRYWVACASGSAESAARAVDLLAGLPGVQVLPPPAASADDEQPPPG